MFFIVLYMFSFIVILYHNYFAMRSIAEKSEITRPPSFFLIYLAFAYGSVGALWFKFGWKLAIIALIISWTIDKFSFRYFLRQYIQLTTKRLINSDWFEIGMGTEERFQRAYEYACRTALNNAKGKPF